DCGDSPLLEPKQIATGRAWSRTVHLDGESVRSCGSFGSLPWFPGPQHAQGETATVLVRFDSRLNLKHRIAHRCESVGFVSLREQFGLHHARPVGEGEKLHRLARDLMMRALLDDEPAGGDGLADKFTETIHRAI